jgi:hypothetical protein
LLFHTLPCARAVFGDPSRHPPRDSLTAVVSLLHLLHLLSIDLVRQYILLVQLYLTLLTCRLVDRSSLVFDRNLRL